MDAKQWYTKPTAGHETHGQSAVYDEATGRDVCIVYDGKADADLIAAAPDLVKACEAALTAFRRMYHDIEKGTIDIEELMNDESYWPLTDLRESLTKARG